MSKARLHIDRLNLPAVAGKDGTDFARQTANALDKELAGHSKTGRIGQVRITATAAEARDPQLLAKAIRRAIEAERST